jgi:hypothetical protein
MLLAMGTILSSPIVGARIALVKGTSSIRPSLKRPPTVIEIEKSGMIVFELARRQEGTAMRRSVQHAILATCISLVYLVVGHGRALADCPFDWRPGSMVGGLDGPVYAMTTWDPDAAGPLAELLVVGGSFTHANGAGANRIATWNGESWQTLGAGMNSDVRSLCVHNGDLIAAGPFTSADGIPCNRVARWDGAAWQPLGPGMNEWVYSVAVHDGELYAGGVFTIAGQNSASRVARWDGSAWQPVGGGVAGPGVPIVFALRSHGGRLIAAGSFSTAGAVPVTNIAAWDGADWAALTSGLSGTPIPQALTLAELNGDLIVAGAFTTAGGAPANNIAKWNGATWSPMSLGANGPVYALAVYDNALIAAGNFTLAGGVPCQKIARWTDIDGWQPLAEGLNNTGRAVGAFRGELVSGGLFTLAGGQASQFLGHWGPTCARGDMDCNSAVGPEDVEPFAAAVLLSPDIALCEFYPADCNGDGVADGADIRTMVQCLLDGTCP